MPGKYQVNVTELIVDVDRFERKMKWKEAWYVEDEEEKEWIPPIFKTNKTSLPTKPSSKPLKNFV